MAIDNVAATADAKVNITYETGYMHTFSLYSFIFDADTLRTDATNGTIY